MQSPPDKLPLTIDDYEVGRVFRCVRTFDDVEMGRFVALARDYNAYHTRPDWMSTHRFGRPILPGLLVGSMVTEIGGQLDLLATKMTFDFMRPVYPGDSVILELRVNAVDRKTRMVDFEADLRNGDGEVVMRAELRGRPPKPEDYARLSRKED